MLFPPTFEHLGVLQLIKDLPVGMKMVTTTTVVCQPRPEGIRCGNQPRSREKMATRNFPETERML